MFPLSYGKIGFDSEPVLEDKTITSNGTYEAGEGYDGLGTVTVNVSGGGATEPYIEETYDEDYYLIGVSLHGHTKVRNNAFASIITLTSVTLSNSITIIGNSAFHQCTALTSLTLPNSLTSIGNYAFYNCRELTSLTLPNSLTSIGNYAFYDCNELTSLTLPNSLISIGERAFGSCDNITSIVFNHIPNSIKTDSFYRCTGVTDIYVPWSQGEVSGEDVKWGATNAIIHYNYTPA